MALLGIHMAYDGALFLMVSDSSWIVPLALVQFDLAPTLPRAPRCRVLLQGYCLCLPQ